MMKKLIVTLSLFMLAAASAASAQTPSASPAPAAPVATTSIVPLPITGAGASSVNTAAPGSVSVIKTIDGNSLAPPMTASEQTVPSKAVPADGTTAPASTAPGTKSTDAQTAGGVNPLATKPGLTVQNSGSPVEREMAEQLDFVKPSIAIAGMKSLFLTLWEGDLVADARRGLNTRPDNNDVQAADAAGPDTAQQPEPVSIPLDSPRELSLAGIAYKSKKNWVIWLNGRQVSPNAIPKEVYDLKVSRDWIDVEWFDAQTNQIFPVRLRPYQRFNLDARIFLPG